MALWPTRAKVDDETTRLVTAAAATPPAVQPFPGPLPGSWSGVLTGIFPVTREEAESVPAIARSVDMVATTIAGLPWESFDAAGTRISLGWWDQPEPDRPRFATINDIVRDAIYDGVSYLVKTSDGTPQRGTCRHVKPTDVTAHSTGYWSIAGYDQPVPSSRIIAFPGWHDGILNHGARTLRTAIALEEAVYRMAKYPRPDQVLQNVSNYELSDEEIDALIADYQSARAASSVAYINAGVKLDTLGWTSAELQLVEARQFAAAMCANLVGVPATRVAGANVAGNSITYQNRTDDNRSFIDDGLNPGIKMLEARLSMSDVYGAAGNTQVTPRGTLVRANLSGLLRGSPIEVANLVATLMPLRDIDGNAVLTADEARKWIDLVPEGNTL